MKRSVAPTPHLRRAGLVVTILSLLAIGFATLVPQAGIASESHLCLVCGSLGGVSALLNILLFVPLGIGLALSGIAPRRAIIFMCALSVSIETAQLLVVSGRNATIGDVLTNTLGGALGFAFARNFFTLLRPPPRTALVLTIGWSAFWLAIQAVFSFGFTPALPRSQYYGQIARCLGDANPFTGQVLSARIADVVVPDTRFSNSSKVRELLLGGATLTIALSPPVSADPVTPIVRIADGSEREILDLAQDVTDMFYGVRTGAAALRLRPPLFVLPGVFATGQLTALTVSASYSAREVWMDARSSANHSRRIPISTSLGWTMLLPFQWFIEGTGAELAVSAIWTACLLLPFGYWASWIVQIRGRRAMTRTAMFAVPGAFAFLYVGLVVVPRGFGLSAAPLHDWFGAFTGIVAGAVLGTLLT